MEELSSIKFDKLTEENYVTWSHRIRWVLELKGLWQAVEEQSTGTSRDRQAKALIGLAVQDRLVPYVTGAATAKDAWDALDRVFKACSNARSLKLTQALTNLSMQPKEALASYAARAKSIWDQQLAIGEDVSERQIVLSLLNGLSEDYRNMVQNVLSTSTDLDLNEVVSKLLLVEQKGVLEIGSDAALYARVARTQDRECWYCHKKGHVKADCLKRKRDNAAASVIPL